MGTIVDGQGREGVCVCNRVGRLGTREGHGGDGKGERGMAY